MSNAPASPVIVTGTGHAMWPYSRTFSIVIVAMLYLVAAKLTHMIASPFGYAIPLWPAAGIAVGALLVWGLRCWPAIVLGSLVAELSRAASFDDASISASAAIAAAIAVSAALQALVGARLVRGLIESDTPLATESSAFRFVLLAGPLACLIAPSIAVSALVWSGRVPPETFTQNWIAWWAGDSIGVMLFAPLMLAVLPKIRRLWDGHIMRTALPILATCLLLAVGSVWLSRSEQALAREKLQEDGQIVGNALSSRLQLLLGKVEGVRGLFAASEQVSHREFSRFVRESAAAEDVHTLEWIPRVPHARRGEFEEQARRSDYPDFRITELDGQGRIVVAGRREAYFPVRFVEPLDGNRRALGFDIGSDPVRRAGLHRAARTGVSAVSDPVSLVQDRPATESMLIFTPVYANGLRSRPQSARGSVSTDRLLGFALGIVPFEQTFAGLIPESRRRQLALTLWNLAADGSRTELYSAGAADTAGGLFWTHPVEFADQRWELELRPAVGHPLSGWHWRTQAYLATTVLVVLLIVLFVLSAAGRNAAIRAEVRRRGAALASENSARRTAESERRDSDERLAIFSEVIREGVVIHDKGKIIEANTAYARMLGVTRERLIGTAVSDFVPPEAYALVQERIVRNDTYTVESLARHADGRVFPIEVFSRPIEHHGKTMRLASVRDLTERKQLEAQRDRFFDLSLDMLCIAGSDGYFRRLNPAFADVLGHSVQDLMAEPVIAFVHPEDLNATNSAMERLLRDESVDNLEHRLRCKDGSWKWLSWKWHRSPEDDLLYGTARDVTALKSATEALNANEKFNRTILESSQDCLQLLSLDGKLIFASEYTRHVLEAEQAGQLDDAMWLELWPAEHRERAAQALAAARAGSTGRFQGFWPTLKGTPKWWDVAVTPIRDGGGNIRTLLVSMRDITASRETEQSFRELKVTLDQILDCVLIFEPDTLRIVYANQGATNQVGFSEEELLTMTPADFSTVHDTKSMIAALAPLVDGSVPSLRIERMRQHRDGRSFPVEIFVQYVGREGGHPRFLSVARDITERKRAEAAAQRRDEQTLRFQSILLDLREHENDRPEEYMAVASRLCAAALEVERVGVWFFDSDRYSLVCQGMQQNRHDGHDYTQSLPMPLYPRLFQALDAEELVSVESVFDNPITRKLSDTYLRPSGIESSMYAPIRLGGQLIGMLSVEHTGSKRAWTPAEEKFLLSISNAIRLVLDNAERRKAEAALRDSEERLALVLSAADLGYWDWNIATGAQTFNARCAEMLGYENGELEQHISAWHRLVHPDDKARVMKTFSDHAKGKTHFYAAEHRLCAKNGDWVWILVRGQIVARDANGKPLRAVGTHLDISETKQSEAALARANESLAQASKAKDQFLATMSHEIRTPLNGMLGMLELLSLGKLGANQRETLSSVRESGQQLMQIVGDVLDYSKIEAGKLELAPAATSIGKIADGVLKTYSGLASSKGLTMHANVDARLSPALWVDPLRLAQILNNFASNAVKFTSQGTIEIGAQVLAGDQRSQTVRLYVRDTGVGIDRKAQARLFQNYQQATHEIARMYGGTGLGLSICRALARQMGGKIDLHSEPGQGTEIGIKLKLKIVEPRTAEQGAIAFERSARPVAGTRPRILIADDHPVNRQLLTRQLAVLGYDADTADHGEDALSLWQNETYGLVITDCHMPKMDGYALARAIRESEDPENRVRIPVIAWTANAMPSEVEHCREAGMDDLLVKPVDLAQLERMLAKWLVQDGDAAQEPPGKHDAEPERSEPERLEPQTLNREILHQITTGPEDEAALLDDFMAQTTKDLGEIDAALAGEDHPALMRAAHRLKGASRLVGAEQLAAIAEAVEHAARDTDTATARDAHTGLPAVLRRLEKQIAKTKSAA